MDFIGEELVELFRIDNLVICGGLNKCLYQEADPLLLARVSMGENLLSLNDRIFIMWTIKLRSELGYKSAGYWSGTRELEDRWGPPLPLREEILCIGGCQYCPIRAAEKITRPCLMNPESPLAIMLCPSDEWIDDFYLTYLLALEISQASLYDMPEELRGYDSFSSPSVSWIGTIHREDGLPSVQFVNGGNIWKDLSVKDNVFWDQMIEAESRGGAGLRLSDSKIRRR